MLPILILFIAIVIVFMILKGSKRRVSSNMSALGNAGKVIIYLTVLKDIKCGRLLSSLKEKDSFGLAAAASANYLFGESPAAQQQSLDLNRIHSDTMQWLSTKQGTKELVVQAVRVLNTINFSRAGDTNVKGTVVLESFGNEFPDAPNPERFLAIVKRELNKLPVDEQDSIRGRFKIS